jgi:AcrR family transcriptional regulator
MNPGSPIAGRPYRQTARAAAAELTRRRIAEAFVDCWREQWFDEITLEEVARRAGVSVRTVIRQFGAKEGLIAGFITYQSPGVEQRRTVSPGDIDQAIERLFENYEADGDATIRALAQEQRHPALRPLIDRGRAGHRAVAAANFAPWLEPLPEPKRRRALDALVIVTDIYTWKLLRRDMGRTEPEARSTMRGLVQAVLAEFTAVG